MTKTHVFISAGSTIIGNTQENAATSHHQQPINKYPQEPTRTMSQEHNIQ